MLLGYQSFPSDVELQSVEYEPLSKSFDVKDTPRAPAKFTSRISQKWYARFSGWRGGVIAATAIAAFVLLLNTIFAIVAATAWNPSNGIATAYIGDCNLAARWTTAIHLFINLLSSLLLGASNYCMQRLTAPTRKEIDHAHSQKKWLDIGMPSVRNLPFISKSRLTLWILLALGSIPLHFVYNSVVFETIAANEVIFLIVAPEFFTDKDSWKGFSGYRNGTLNSTNPFEMAMHDPIREKFVAKLQNTLLDGKYADRTKFKNLTGPECIARYTSSFISSGNGFGVPSLEARQAHLWPSGTYSLGGIIPPSSGKLQLKYDSYDYCLSQVQPGKCEIQLSQTILYIVIVCNILKISTMGLILIWHNHETIVTVGDAIKSFLQQPDYTTKDCCLMSRWNVDELWKVPEARLTQRFQPERRACWYKAISSRRWRTSLVLYFATIMTAIALRIVSTTRASPQVGHNGFGQVDSNFLVDIAMPYGKNSVIPFILLANLPQAIISFVYLTYNGLYTGMLANREWSKYSVKRAPLRVTLPSPNQRSTYFLQLPYTFSVPLLGASILLHWFISQSIFLARIAIYDGNGRLKKTAESDYGNNNLSELDNIYTGLGYSSSALMACIIWGITLVVVCGLVGQVRTYPKGIPIGGTNSAVISAACHIRGGENGQDKEEDVADCALQWGVTIPGTKNQVGHCSFSSDEVWQPEKGHLYAGLRSRM